MISAESYKNAYYYLQFLLFFKLVNIHSWCKFCFEVSPQTWIAHHDDHGATCNLELRSYADVLLKNITLLNLIQQFWNSVFEKNLLALFTGANCISYLLLLSIFFSFVSFLFSSKSKTTCYKARSSLEFHFKITCQIKFQNGAFLACVFLCGVKNAYVFLLTWMHCGVRGKFVISVAIRCNQKINS